MSYEGFNTETSTANTSGTLVSSHDITTVAGSGAAREHVYGDDGLTLDSRATLGRQTEKRIASTNGVGGGLKKALLVRAIEVIDSLLEDTDPVRTEVNSQSLRTIVLGLWETASHASVFHQEILSILESAVLTVESPSTEQLQVFREAALDLKADLLTQAHVDVIRAQFIKKGFNPLAVLDNMEDDNG